MKGNLRTDLSLLHFLKKKSQAAHLFLEDFKNIPEEITGCSGLYRSANCKSSCNYLLTTYLQGKASIKVDNKIIALKRTSTSVTQKKTKERYQREGFTITIELYPVEQLGDALWQYQGELKLIKGDLKFQKV